KTAMNILYLLIGCSLFMALIFLAAFIWFVRSGQMDDDYTPSVRILFDDQKIIPEEEVNEQKKNPD
ncbi:MAG: cbb3-type cytochrome oxidase assembly protein CcoS, partial [Bacteroidia bacterium]